MGIYIPHRKDFPKSRGEKQKGPTFFLARKAWPPDILYLIRRSR
jgi:hypothetical protein